MALIVIYRTYNADFYYNNYPLPPPVTEEDYLSVHDSATCPIIYENAGIGAEQALVGFDEGFYVRRASVFWDTSSMEGMDITSVTLRVWLYHSSSGVYCGVTIQNGQPDYPHNPGVVGDYSLEHYSGNGGQVPAGLPSGWYDIELTDDGLSWINKTGYTKFMFRSDNDIDTVLPTHSGEGYGFRNDYAVYAPQLRITYEIPTGYDYPLYPVIFPLET